MSVTPPPPGLAYEDFDRIEAAVMETERGRWFLTEHARRIRAEGADAVMASLSHIQDSLNRSETRLETDAVQRIIGWAEAIEERLRDLAWRLREEGSNSACATVESEIVVLRALTAPSLIAPAGWDASSNASRHLQDSVVAGARQRRSGHDQDGPGALSHRLRSIDQAEQGPAFAVDPPHVSPRLAPEAVDDASRIAAFAPLDALSPREKLEFFA